MASSLSTERVALLRMIEELERLSAGLPSDNAGVSNHGRRKVQELRARLDGAPMPTKLYGVWRDAQPVLKAVAAELLRLWLGTLLNCFSLAVYRLAGLYDNRRVHKVAAYCSGLNAIRTCRSLRNISLNVVAA